MVLTGHLQGQVAFNSWGEKDFWARAIRTGNSSEYSTATVMSQVPEGGVYVALARIQGPPRPPGDNPAEYALTDLSGLFEPHDWRREANQGAQFFQFYKWGRDLSIEIACSPKASGNTVSQLNDLLQSWRFDPIPVGDLEWAGTLARLLLPEQVEPLSFGIRSSWQSAPGNLARVTEAEVRGRTVHFRFTYIWNLESTGSIPAPIPAASSHWWEVDVLPTGEAVLVGQGGAPLPAQ